MLSFGLLSCTLPIQRQCILHIIYIIYSTIMIGKKTDIVKVGSV